MNVKGKRLTNEHLVELVDPSFSRFDPEMKHLYIAESLIVAVWALNCMKPIAESLFAVGARIGLDEWLHSMALLLGLMIDF